MSQSARLPGPAQRALQHVTRRALRGQPEARAELADRMRAGAVPDPVFAAALERLRAEGRVALAFHPERALRGGPCVAESLLEDGVYRTQFETGLSSGGTSAYSGGERDGWERRLFGGAYHERDVSAAERPRYGALFLVDHPDGPCPRFGSSTFVLSPAVSQRCSFTPLGSQEAEAPEQTGTLAVPEPWLAALARHLERVSAPLGVPGLDLAALLRGMSQRLPIAREERPADSAGRSLDSFVEAQVHGPLSLRDDVEALVVDASFHGTAVGETLRELARTYDIALRWHPGFALEADAFPDTFRGFPTRCIAARVAVRGVVDAAALGAGQNDFMERPEAWAELGSRSDAFTAFRRVWHVLVLFGRPSSRWRTLEA